MVLVTGTTSSSYAHFNDTNINESLSTVNSSLLDDSKCSSLDPNLNNYGYDNSTIDFSYLDDDIIFDAEYMSNLPQYYDLRTMGRVTPVKDQDPLGTCWAFAATGSLESCLLPLENWNFSENHLKNLCSNLYPEGFDRNYSRGGDWTMALAYFARYSGPVNASSDPYNTSSGISPSGLQPVKHVQDCIIIPRRNGSLNNEQLKAAIMKYGAVDTSMFYDGYYYNNYTNGYYLTEAKTGSNHAICLVGWDDNYPKDNFYDTAPGNGAFIVRNSWGSNWGDNGYFYISYYDAVLAKMDEGVVFMNADPTTNYKQVYQYDPFGIVDQTGFNKTNAWFSNVFTANSTNPLAACSFFSLAPDTLYNLYVYLDPSPENPRSGTLALSQSGDIQVTGYHTIKFDECIPLKLGQKFSIVLNITTPNLTKPIAFEFPRPNYCSKATANPGEGFISSDGVNWQDMTSLIANASVCLKAFTVSSAKLTINQEVSNSDPKIGDIIQLTIKVLNSGPDHASGVKITDKLPSGLTIKSFSSNYGKYDPFDGLWDIGDLPLHALASLIIFCQVEDHGELLNMITVSSTTYNPNPNKSASTAIHVVASEVYSPTADVIEASIPLKHTGLPLTPIVLTVLMILCGTVSQRRK